MEESWYDLSALLIFAFPIAGLLAIAFCLKNGKVPYFFLPMNISKSENPVAFYGFLTGLLFATCLLAILSYGATESVFAG